MNPKRIICLVISILMVFSCAAFADTEDGTEDITGKYVESAAALYQLGLMSVTGDNGLDLESAPDRLQGAQEIVKLIGAADIVQSYADSYPTTFADVSGNDAGYVGYLESMGVDISRSDAEFGPDDALSAETFTLGVLQALDYQTISKNSSPDEIYSKAVETGLLTWDEVTQLKSVPFTRGTMAFIARKALDVLINGSDLNVYYYLEQNGDLHYLDYPSDSVIYGKTSVGETILGNAYKYMGVRYRSGGRSPSGFDCSGYVGYVMIQSGVWDRFYGDCNGVSGQCTKVSKSEARPGDIVFFTGTSRKKGYTHVGIYIGNGKMINAASSQGVSIASINSGYWGSHYSCIKRPNAMM